jgi:hypothetical protein
MSGSRRVGRTASARSSSKGDGAREGLAARGGGGLLMAGEQGKVRRAAPRGG